MLQDLLNSFRGRYLLLVLVPTLLCFGYLGLFSSNGFVSRTQIKVEQDTSLASAEIPVLSLLSVGGGASKQDALVLQSYLQSRSMLDHLDQKLDLRQHFSSSEVDWFSRLSSDASQQRFLTHYHDHLNLFVDEQSLILSIEFVAYEAAFARQVLAELVAQGEIFVNEISHQLARQQLAFVEKEVERANSRLQESALEMIKLQRQYDMFSAEGETRAVGEILAGLEVELARERTQLKALLSFLNPEAPDVVAAQQRIQALQKQASQERAKLVGEGEGGLNVATLEYKGAEVNLRLASELYGSALAALETKRLDAVRKVKYLVSIDSPTLPDAAEHPRVAYWTATVFVFLNAIYFVIGLVVAAIKDHRE